MSIRKLESVFPDDVFAEILAKGLGVRNLAPVFPGHDLDEKKRLALIA
ncbi:MAG: hypothetical protein ABI682_15010 [Acidobacteriota bacterium]